MRVGYARGLGVPPSIRAPSRRRTGPRDGWVSERDALTLIARALAPRGIERAVIPFSAPYRPPPVLLYRAGTADELTKLDYSHLYARLAADVLERAGYRDYARWFRERIEAYTSLPGSLRTRYVLVSRQSEWAEAWTHGGDYRTHRACRRFWLDAADEPPLTLDEALEIMRRTPCTMYAVPVKAVAKYVPHIVVGMSRRWGTGMWESVINESWRAMHELIEVVGTENVAAYVVDAAIVYGAAAAPRTRHPVKVDARGPGLVVLPFLYRVGDEYGMWAVWREPPVVRRSELTHDGRLVLRQPVYRGGEEVLKCTRPPSPETRSEIESVASLVGVELGHTLCDVVDARPGEPRVIKRLVENGERVGAPHVEH